MVDVVVVEMDEEEVSKMFGKSDSALPNAKFQLDFLRRNSKKKKEKKKFGLHILKNQYTIRCLLQDPFTTIW